MCDGYTVFQGPAIESQKYFSDLGFKSSRFSNPADIFMKALSINYPQTENDIAKIQNLVMTYDQKQLRQIN